MRLPTPLLRRKLNSHKYDFGNILVLAGSARFLGAGILCAHAALRAGAGLVTLGVPKSLNRSLIKIKLPELMTLPLTETKDGALSLSAYSEIKKLLEKADVLVIGPGLSQNKTTQALIRKIIKTGNTRMVIDADGLNALANHLDLLNNKMILTPHEGELARLLGCKAEVIRKDRPGIAKQFARQHKVTLVLKGHRTVVTDDKNNFYLNQTGNPGMSTAGSGDVLTGIIAAFLGQGLDNFGAAKYAAYLHGVAGDLAAKRKTQVGMIASDIITMFPEAIRQCH